MQKGIRNAVLNGRGLRPFATNAPSFQHKDNEEQFYASETKQFYLQNLKYTSDLVTAQVQGIDYDDFYTYRPLRIRVAALVDPTTGNNLGDDWRRITTEDTNIEFLPRGAKIVFNGNTWLVTNPSNMSDAIGTAIIKRCNATWCHLDWYGNVLREPFCYGQGGNDLATANNVKINMILIDAYQHCVMQLNPDTAELAHNRRILLGRQAYALRGMQNFAQEFSDRLDSMHIQFFDVGAEEMLKSIDDLDNRVADGKGFLWAIHIDGQANIQSGSTAAFTAHSVRNGKALPNGTFYVQDEIGEDGSIGQTVSDTGDKREVSYLWGSSDTGVATVNTDGTVTAVSAGTATITCKLEQNPDKFGTMEITVSEEPMQDVLQWVQVPPESLRQYASATIRAALFTGGEESGAEVEYAFSGADGSTYATEATDDGGIQITAYDIPFQPIHVTATSGEHTIAADIRITGW